MDAALFPAIPFETLMAARAVFGKSNFYIVTGNQANHLFEGIPLDSPMELDQKPPRNLAMLYLITIFQFAETLSDHSAIDAIRERIDWKYALHLDMNFPGMDSENLCEFRHWLTIDSAAQQNLKKLLLRMSALMDINGKQCNVLEPDQLISVVCQVSRLSKIWDAFSRALNTLAVKFPDWLLANSQPYWQERYRGYHRVMSLRSERLERYILAQEIGADGMYLLEAIDKTDQKELGDLDEIVLLRQVWLEQFQCVNGQAWWRKKNCPGCEHYIS